MAIVKNAELFRYGTVGVISNVFLYICYLLLAEIGLAPKIAMSATYFIGTLQAFIFQKKWTFGHEEKSLATFFMYCSVYIAGYFINLALLFIMIDSMLLQHQISQAISILIVSLFLFISQKYWVFRKNGGAEN